MKGNCFEDVTLSLIDFGFATSYIESKTGKHKKKRWVDFFRGNLLFSSASQLKFYETSRRDDVISTFYIMVYYLHQADMPGIDWVAAAEKSCKERHDIVKDFKDKNLLKYWC